MPDLVVKLYCRFSHAQAHYVTSGIVIDADLQCGAIVTEPSGYIVATDRDGDGEYDADLQCVWVIAAPVGTGIELEFEYIDIESDDECAFDSLEVRRMHYGNKAMQHSEAVLTLCSISGLD